MTGMEVVLCAPETADAEITNAEHLVGKMAVVYAYDMGSNRQTDSGYRKTQQHSKDM